MNDPDRIAPAARRLAFRTWAGFIALGMGSGLAPVAPGTFGTVAALPLGLALLHLSPHLFWSVWVFFFVLGVRCCELTSRRLGAGDPGAIVWDEMVAMWLVLACVPRHWGWWVAAFILFRLFDIAKPWPIRTLEHRVGGGMGIMLDDMIAALFALAFLLPARFFL